jgi:hypothetical protein
MQVKKKTGACVHKRSTYLGLTCSISHAVPFHGSTRSINMHHHRPDCSKEMLTQNRPGS